MAHDLGSAKNFDVSDTDFDDEVTAERVKLEDIYNAGLESKVDLLGKAIFEERTDRLNQMAAQAIEFREIADATTVTSETVLKALDEMRKLTKLVLEERAERFALGDRVSSLEQPRTTRRKR